MLLPEYRLLRQMMALLFAGHIKPIGPMKTFPFTDIPGAFRYMRGGTHVGKIVITNGPAGQPKVKVCFKTRLTSTPPGCLHLTDTHSRLDLRPRS